MQPNSQSVSRCPNAHDEFKNFWQLISNSENPASLVCHCSNSCRQDIFLSFWRTEVAPLVRCYCRGRGGGLARLAQNVPGESIHATVLHPRGESAFSKETSVTEDKRDFLTVPQTQPKVPTAVQCAGHPFNWVRVQTHPFRIPADPVTEYSVYFSPQWC